MLPGRLLMKIALIENGNALNRGTVAFLLVLAGLLGVSHPTSAEDGKFVNLSTRAVVGTGEEVMIGGFIIEGGARQVLIQALGPELANFGLSNALADPVLTVTASDGTVLMMNDNWEDSQGQLVVDLWGGSPNLTAGSLSSAAVLTLQPGNYTAKVEGKNGTTGVAIVEVYAVDSPGSASPDREALVALYNATDGSNWTDKTNWLSEEPLAEWYGVTTDGDGRVTHLDLRFNRLNGPIPAQLGDLANLTELDLLGNQLSGPIPPELGNLSSLKYLGLDYNRLSGPIPVELGDLANLEWLWMSNNQLSGSIPADLGKLANLVRLDLAFNRLSGPIPAQLGDLANLEWLSLQRNGFSDLSPLSGLTNLRVLQLTNNRITDLGPLVANTGLGANDELYVKGNPLSANSINVLVPALQARGVSVSFDENIFFTDPQIYNDNLFVLPVTEDLAAGNLPWKNTQRVSMVISATHSIS